MNNILEERHTVAVKYWQNKWANIIVTSFLNAYTIRIQNSSERVGWGGDIERLKAEGIELSFEFTCTLWTKGTRPLGWPRPESAYMMK